MQLIVLKLLLFSHSPSAANAKVIALLMVTQLSGPLNYTIAVKRKAVALMLLTAGRLILGLKIFGKLSALLALSAVFATKVVDF